MPKFLGGKVTQDIFPIDSVTHQAFHLILHKILQAYGFPGGFGKKASAKNYAMLLNDPKRRNDVRKAIVSAANAIDRLCGWKGEKSLARFTNDIITKTRF